MAAHGAHLQRRGDDQDAEGGDEDRRARAEGDHRRRRMPVGAPAPHPRRRRRKTQARQAGRARTLWRRRRDLHRRPFLHPPVRLPLADGETLARSAARRSGGDGGRLLRRLRPVRRGRARGRAVPLVLSRRDRAQCRFARADGVRLAQDGDPLVRRRHCAGAVGERRSRRSDGAETPGRQASRKGRRHPARRL